jgi:hypothetical protein
MACHTFRLIDPWDPIPGCVRINGIGHLLHRSVTLDAVAVVGRMAEAPVAFCPVPGVAVITYGVFRRMEAVNGLGEVFAGCPWPGLTEGGAPVA